MEKGQLFISLYQLHNMIKIAITDDHPLIVKGISSLIEKEEGMQIVQTFDNGNSTISGFGNHDIDVLLLDFNLPDMDGESICKEVIKISPKIKILILTSFDETAILKRVMSAGALGFVLKTASDAIIVEGIKTVGNGQQFIQKELQNKLIAESISLKKEVGYLPKLTRREKEILSLILEELTTAEIAEKLFLSPKTVETHRLNMMQKLNVKNTAGLVKLAVLHSLV